MSFNFMAAITMCSDFGAKKKKPVNCLKGGKKAMFCISVFVGLKIALLCECMSSKIRIMPYSTVLYPVAFFN